MESTSPAKRRTAAAGSGAADWNVNGLFRRRVARFWTEQWRVWRTALDWTVWLYLLVPALWIGGGLYVELWHHQPAWMMRVPLWAGERAPFFLVFIGRLRTFAEDADVLFLLQRKEWMTKLSLRGMLYTAAALAFAAALVYGLLLPFLLALHHVPPGRITLLYAFAVLLAYLGAVLRSLIEARYRGIRKLAAKYGCGIALAALYAAAVMPSGQRPVLLAAAIAAVFAAVLWFSRVKLRARYAFETDVRSEHEARLASTTLLLRGVIERRPRLRLNKPVLLRGSNRLFRTFDGGTMLAEASLKSFIRRLPLLKLWLQFAVVSAAAVALTPFALKLALVAVLPVALGLWAQSHWRGVAAEPFIAQFKWTDGALKKSAELTRLWIAAPAAALLALLAGAQTYGAPGLLLVVPAAAVWYVVNKAMSDFLMLRRKRDGGA